MSKNHVLHVVCGTHWDREWRHTAEESKLKLADLVDGILDVLENKPSYKSFCLDGGLVVVEDYLTARPENKERLRELTESKRLSLVSWYTLPEMFTVSPEAQIRNLLLGRRMAGEFGGAMRTGYTATSYGQHSQLPQIYQGFGIKTAVFYRGTNRYELPPLCLWEGKDGSQLHLLKTFDEYTRQNWFFLVHRALVLGKSGHDLSYTFNKDQIPVHMCDERLYQKSFRLLREETAFESDQESLKTALRSLTDQIKPYAIGKHLLALNMEDNDRPFALLPEMIDALNKISDDTEIVQSSLDEYVEGIISEFGRSEMHVHRGELRYPTVTPGLNCLLGAVYDSRVKLKLLNESAETALSFQAEPLASFAMLCGSEYPRTMFDRAWRFLLQNHAHDSICGCAVDQAHEDMLYRFSAARAVANEVTARSCFSLHSRIDTVRDFREDDHTITFFNTLAQPRKEIVLVVVDLPREASGKSIVDPCIGVGGKGDTDEIHYFDIVDHRGNAVDHEILSKEDVEMAVERVLDCQAIKFPSNRRRLLIEVDVPALGYATYALRPRGPRFVEHPEHGRDRPLIARESGVLENENIRVEIGCNGTFSLLHKESGRVMPNLHYFTDGGQIGSAHMYMEPQRNPIVTSHGCAAKMTVEETGLLRGIWRVDITLPVPAAATLDGRDRVRQEVEIPITYWLTLTKGGEYLKIRTRLHNSARDHRLRVHFPTGISTDYAAAESAFAVEERCVRWTETGDNMERFYAFQPMQNFVDVSDAKTGLAFLSKGLRMYEVMDDPDRTIAVTLLRTHRAYMTANADMTPEEFDQYTGLHSFGDLEYEYALYPHTGGWEEGEVLQNAYRHKVDVRALQSVPKEGGLPPVQSLLSISPHDKLMLSALKQSEDGQGVVLRVWNTSSEKLDAVIATVLPIKAASRVRLDETPIEELGISNGHINLEIKPHKIETILLTGQAG